jgi:UDP-N-acetylmuramate dehydrogenase
VRVTVAAGEVWDDVVSRCVARGWSGVEALSGIPGRAGATPVQNVGAYGQEIAQVLVSVRVYDRVSSTVLDLPASECGFGYRMSRFKSEPARWLVLAMTLDLSTSGLGEVRYAELATLLGVEVGAPVASAAIRGAVLALRSRKAMVLDAGNHDAWSAGSFFTNPVVSPEVAERIPDGCPRYPAVSGVKLSAAWLIEQSGVGKGFALPGSRAAISTVHTLALTNRGGATAAEVLDLAAAVQAAVRDRFAIDLVPEPVIL